MGKPTQLALLAAQLERLSRDRNWLALAALDREVAALVALLSKQPQLRAEEYQRLDELKSAHAAALAHCDREFSRIDRGLTQLRVQRQGWMAYAMGNEEERA
jgi:hypothetical protein